MINPQDYVKVKKKLSLGEKICKLNKYMQKRFFVLIVDMSKYFFFFILFFIVDKQHEKKKLNIYLFC